MTGAASGTEKDAVDLLQEIKARNTTHSDVQRAVDKTLATIAERKAGRRIEPK